VVTRYHILNKMQHICLVCDKGFASTKNLERHHNRMHKVCETPPYLCNFCHTGFLRWEDYQFHYNQRLIREHIKKSKKRQQNLPLLPPETPPESPISLRLIAEEDLEATENNAHNDSM
jgi:hypothetical protein